MDARNPTGIKPAATIESFRPGDTVTVNVKIKEGDRERVQAFQGNVIAGSYNQGETPAPGASFTVRRISYGVGVERIFPICSPMIDAVKLVRRGKVRQARLYYLRGLTGRAARIKERRGQVRNPAAELIEQTPAQPAVEQQPPEAQVASEQPAAAPVQSPAAGAASAPQA